MSRQADDAAVGMVLPIAVAVGVIIALTLTGFWWFRWRVVEQNMITEGDRQTEQYRASKETLLLDKLSQAISLDTKIATYERDPANDKIVAGMKAQQAVLVVQLHAEADRLKPNQVPPTVRDYLDKHPAPVRQ